MIENNKYSKLLTYFIAFLLSIFLANLLQSIAILKIFNPDIDNYYILYDFCSISSGCAVEPFFWMVSELGHQLELDYGFLYFAYPFLTCFIILATAISWRGVGFVSRMAFVIIWFATFGVLHTLVQIRFGLACAFAVFAATAAYPQRTKVIALILGALSHFAVLLTLLSLLPRVMTDRRLSLLANFASMFAVAAIKTGDVFNFLPRFLSARLLVYSAGDLEALSLLNQAISFSLYLYLTVCVFCRRLPPIFSIAAIGFIPYFIAPDFEILIRVGVPFQLILLAAACQNLKKGSNFLYPLILFFSYKVFSNVSYALFLWGG
jgi:hypothetical protein